MNPSLIKWIKAHVDYPDIDYDGLRKAGMPEDVGPQLSIVVLPFENRTAMPNKMISPTC